MSELRGCSTLLVFKVRNLNSSCLLLPQTRATASLRDLQEGFAEKALFGFGLRCGHRISLRRLRSGRRIRLSIRGCGAAKTTLYPLELAKTFAFARPGHGRLFTCNCRPRSRLRLQEFVELQKFAAQRAAVGGPFFVAGAAGQRHSHRG
jgi:hypothetical protein